MLFNTPPFVQACAVIGVAGKIRLSATLATFLAVVGFLVSALCMTAVVCDLLRSNTPKGYRKGECPSCGYQLRGLPVRRCPECGRPFSIREAGPGASRRLAPEPPREIPVRCPHCRFINVVPVTRCHDCKADLRALSLQAEQAAWAAAEQRAAELAVTAPEMESANAADDLAVLFTPYQPRDV